VEVDDPVSRFIRLRGKLGSCRDFGELKNSAGMLVVAILEPVEFRLTAPPPKKTAQVYQFPPRKRIHVATLGDETAARIDFQLGGQWGIRSVPEER
jgi:hypothetical protein